MIPFWSKEPKTKCSTINARAETVATAATYRVPFKRSRCLITASGFYEWVKTANGKQPYNIRPGNNEFLTFAGLWDVWHEGEEDELTSCTIITTEANKTIEPIHNRMPVILDKSDYDLWMGSDDLQMVQELLGPVQMNG